MWQVLVLCCGLLGPPPDIQGQFVQLQPAHVEQSYQRTAGRDCAVVLLHGFQLGLTTDSVRRAKFQDWQRSDSTLVSELAGSADVYAFAYGQNEPVDSVAHVPTLRDGIKALKQLGYRHVVLFGHSAGGVVARQFVEDYPEAGVTKVIQVCTPNGGSYCARLAPFCRKAQQPFVESLTEQTRRRIFDNGKKVPTRVQFLCVVGTRDWVVSCLCQWTPDLQNQGIPVITLPLAHEDAVYRAEHARELRALVMQDHPRWTTAQVDAARGPVSVGLLLGQPGQDGSVFAKYPAEWFRPVTVGGRPGRTDRIALGPRQPVEDLSMTRSTSWSVQGFSCALLLLASAPVPATTLQGDEPAAVTRGKKLIAANADKICRYAHAYSTYGYKDNEFIGHKKTKDGYYELAFKFTVKGNIKTQTMHMTFFFRESGSFEFLKVSDYTTIYEPFNRLSAGYLKELRQEMSKRPVVQKNTELVRVVDTATARELCEMHLKFAQASSK
ncbi:MAG: alpha/beta hydrolase [Gemmataceae bacterium]|nr:alpha/beta hydrolase [Gemmataceae bacterium]